MANPVSTWLAKQSTPLGRATLKFHAQRLDFYGTLADRLEGAKDGNGVSLVSLFEKDAERYAGTPRGLLSAYWADQYMATATLAETWEGTLPGEEVACVAVAEKRGNEALIDALRDMERVGGVVAAAQSEFKSTVGVALFGALIAFAMVLSMPFVFKANMAKQFEGISPEFYGSLTKWYFATSDVIAVGWLPFVLALGAGVWTMVWALPNWTGVARARMDDTNLLFGLYRQFRGAMFLATFASLTKSSGGEVTNQRNALEMMQERSTPWVAWKIRQMIEHIDEEGVHDASALDVGIVDKEIFYIIVDVFEARGISAGLTVAGRKTEGRALKTISKRAKLIRYALLGICVAIVLALTGWQYGVMWEFKKAMQAQYSTT